MSKQTLSTDEKLDKVLIYLNEKYVEAHKVTINEYPDGSSSASVPNYFKTGAFREDMEIYGAIRKEYMEDLFAQIPLILSFLKDEGYVTEHKEASLGNKVKYRITFKGIDFIENGGFRKKSEIDRNKEWWDINAKRLFWLPMGISALSLLATLGIAGWNHSKDISKEQLKTIQETVDSIVKTPRVKYVGK